MTPLSPEAETFLAAGGPARPWPSLTPIEARAQALAARRPDTGAPAHGFAVMSAFPVAQAEAIDEIAIAIDRWLRPTVA